MTTDNKRDNERSTSDLVRLGDLLRTTREDQGISMRRLAARLNIAHATLGRIETGESERPTPETLSALAEALELDEADLFALAGYRLPSSLPTLPAYLRAKYDLPPEAAAQLTDYFYFLAERHGIDPSVDHQEPNRKPPRPRS